MLYKLATTMHIHHFFTFHRPIQSSSPAIRDTHLSISLRITRDWVEFLPKVYLKFFDKKLQVFFTLWHSATLWTSELMVCLCLPLVLQLTDKVVYTYSHVSVVLLVIANCVVPGLLLSCMYIWWTLFSKLVSEIYTLATSRGSTVDCVKVLTCGFK